MARAQLNIGVDVNANQAKKKLNEIKQEGVDTVEEIGAKNREALKGFIGMFAPMAIAVGAVITVLGAVKEAFVNAFSQGEIFDEFAERAKASAQSVAYLKAQADSAGISTKEFEEAMDDLGSGKTTIQALREEWGRLSDSIDVASKATSNFISISRKKNLDDFKTFFGDMFAGLIDSTINFIGGGGRNAAIIEESAFRGESLEDAIKNAQRYHSTSLRRMSRSEMETIYYRARAKMYQDERESTLRNREYWLNALASNEKIDDVALEATFNEKTNHNWSAKRIREEYETLRQRDEGKYAVDVAVEESQKRKKAQEDALKAQDEANKKIKENADAILKEQQALAKVIYEDDDVLNTREKKLAKYAEMTGERVDWDTLYSLATSTITKDQMLQRDLREEKKLQDERKKAEEEELKSAKENEEKRKKLAEERRKEESAYIDSFTKTAWSLTDAWTDGGGLIGNARYGLRNQKATDEQIKLANQQLKQAISQSKSLKEIEEAIKGDK